jgi:hypothetical protein
MTGGFIGLILTQKRDAGILILEDKLSEFPKKKWLLSSVLGTAMEAKSKV